MSFDIFPIVKKKGKATCAIGNRVYSYNGLKQQIVFGLEKEQNMQLLESDAKLYTIIQFSAMLLHIEMVGFLPSFSNARHNQCKHCFCSRLTKTLDFVLRFLRSA